MGELSKKIGEIGEELSKHLLDMIGWKLSVRNLSIPCNTASHVNENGNRRHSHGEDQIYIYHNPFHDDYTEIVHISVKSLLEYPGEATLKTKFKSHLKELHETIECARHSRQLRDLVTNFGARKNKHHSGLLVWLHNDGNSPEKDIKPLLANARLEQTNDIPIYLIDNSRAAFLYKVVDDLRSRSPRGTVEFFYPPIGTAIGVQEGRSGPFLPLELIAADIIPALVRSESGAELVLYANQSFSVDAYKRLIAYAFKFGMGINTSARIGMPDYNAGLHENDALQARISFGSRFETVSPFSFNRNIFTILGERSE